jgi:hypothetical protein
MTVEFETGLPLPSVQALRAYRDLASDLSQWAPTVHRLVRERIAALVEANGRYEHPLETAEQYAERVLAKGQYPFPAGVSIYENLNDNTGYDHIDIGYGLEGDGELRITFTGWYPHWSLANDEAEEEDYERRSASIHCPGWLVTDPDGVDRYRKQTQEMVAEVRKQRAAEAESISVLLDSLRNQSDSPSPSEEGRT